MYKITLGQKNAITISNRFNGMYFNPVQDFTEAWFISEVEKNFCEANFGWTLTLTEFIPPTRNVNIRG